MNLMLELAREIMLEDDFWDDYEKIITQSILIDTSSNDQTNDAKESDFSLISRLLQAALIFSNCEDEQFINIAQKISTSALKITNRQDTNVNNIFSLIQGRLANFPALSEQTVGKLDWKNIPSFLQFDFFHKKIQQTISTENGRAYTLTPFQFDIWDCLSNKKSISLSGPTSSGKSYVLLNFIAEQFKTNHITIAAYLVPTRALINQVSDDAALLFEKLDLHNISISTIPINIGIEESSKTIYILTQERLELLLISSPNISIDILVIDESQVLNKGSRGVLLESVIDRIIHSDNKTQIIFSGPLIANPEYFGSLFDIKDFLPISTSVSPVTQNIILLDYDHQPESKVDVSLFTNKKIHVTSTLLPISLLTDLDKISYISTALGASGSNIVYANGKSDSEKIALKISNELPQENSTADELDVLIKFVKRHIHKDYALVETLKKGVAFHYGHMPALLRKTLEEFFRKKRISYLVCTSTLLYGINLPTKNIFMLKPTTGRGTPISGPDFWNLSGRAGRLGKELEGNVYLIDYEKWDNPALTESKATSLISSIESTITTTYSELLDYLDNDGLASETKPTIETTTGKLILDCRNNRLSNTLNRYLSKTSKNVISTVESKIKNISDSIILPSHILNQNIRVSPFRQQDLFKYFQKRLKELSPIELIPMSPLLDFDIVLANHRRAFKRIHTYLLKYKSKDNRHLFFSGIALRWMRGDTLPILINSAIKFYKKQQPNKSTASIIRDTMEIIEDDLRFRYVKFFTCYNSLLIHALEESGLSKYIPSIPDIPLFLEVGGSSGVMINLMALGLSRTTAETLSDYITNKNASVNELRDWLLATNLSTYDLSPICLNEIGTLISKSI